MSPSATCPHIWAPYFKFGNQNLSFRPSPTYQPLRFTSANRGKQMKPQKCKRAVLLSKRFAMVSKLLAKPQVLIAAVPFYAHVEKLRIIAADLVQRGYKVSFISASIFRESIERIGATFIPLHGIADFNSFSIVEMWPARETIPAGPKQLCHDLKNCFILPAVEQFRAVQHFLANTVDPVVMIQDSMFMGALPPLLGAPGLHPTAVLAVGISPIMFGSVDTAPFNSGLPPDSSRQGRIRNIAMREDFRKALGGPQQTWVEVLKGLGATETEGFFMDMFVTLADCFLQLSIPELEYPRSDAPMNLRFVGALSSSNKRSNNDISHSMLPPWWDEVLRHETRIVVVSQGTTNNDPHDLIIPTLKALRADPDILVVATLVRGDSLDPGSVLPANARIAKFVPFDLLFPHADLVVSNGGYGTIQQAFGAGVPMVLAGLTEDHAEASARAAWTGAAVNLAVQRPGVAVVREAVHTVLATDAFRRKARHLSKLYEKYDSLQQIADTVDEVALWRA